MTRLADIDLVDILADNEHRKEDAYLTAGEAAAMANELIERRAADLNGARQLVAELQNRAFRICESVPKEDAHYLEGADAKEWSPLEDKRAVEVVAYIGGVLTRTNLRKLCNGQAHRNHAEVTCAGSCCSNCGGPIDDDQECRC